MLSAISSSMAQGRKSSRSYIAVPRDLLLPSRDTPFSNWSAWPLYGPFKRVPSTYEAFPSSMYTRTTDLLKVRVRSRKIFLSFPDLGCNACVKGLYVFFPGFLGPWQSPLYCRHSLSWVPLFSPQEQPGLEVDTAITCLSHTSHPSIDLIYNSIYNDYRLFLEDDVINSTSGSLYSRSMKGVSDFFSVSDGLVPINSRRIVLPLPAVKPVLKLLHASHSGVNKTKNLARDLYFWTEMNSDIKKTVSSCCECLRMLQSQTANPMTTSLPSCHLGYPMQHIGLDLFNFGGKHYLICVDHWSGYPMFSALRSLSSDSIIKNLVNWFNLLGYPVSIRSDGGPQFCLLHNIRHKLLAPYNPKSNGLLNL